MNASPHLRPFDAKLFSEELVDRINQANDREDPKTQEDRLSVKVNIPNFLPGPTENLAQVAHALRERFGTRISSSAITNGRDTASFDLLCTPIDKQAAHNKGQVVCSVTVRVKDGTVNDLELRISEYYLLLSEGRICLDPGAVSPDSLRANRAANYSLIKAITVGEAPSVSLGEDSLVHGRIETYVNVFKNLDTRIVDTTGYGRMGELLNAILAEFRAPIIDPVKEISHGCTTTFKSRIGASFNSTFMRYDLFASFRSPNASMNECWIRIAPPLTLAELLT